MRLDNVDSNMWVDETILIEDSIEQVLKSIRPDIVLKGKEYEDFQSRKRNFRFLW